MSDLFYRNIACLDECLAGICSVGISGHVRPDGDCTGSTLAVYNYIREAYPQIDVRLYLEPIRDVFSFLQYSSEIITLTGEEKAEALDLFIALDCSEQSRLGEAGRWFEQARKTLCIDHHKTNRAFGDYYYIFPEASSASELVYELLPADKVSFAVAECLYTGIVHDTGVFKFSCTSSRTMEIAGRLMDLGIDYPKIVDDTFDTLTWTQNRIQSYAILAAEKYLNDQVLLTCLTEAEIRKYDATAQDLGGIVNQLRITKGIRIAAFLYESAPGVYKGSLRVNGDTDLTKIAAAFGGGGHAKAAGFTIEGEKTEVISRLVEEIGRHL